MKKNSANSILIAGATASGKSALALALAESLGGEIINADAMQSYRELRILSARPSTTEEARLPHHLYGYLGSDDDSSVAAWMEQAEDIAQACLQRGRIPILVGGASLYITCFDQGLARIPPIPTELRRSVRERIESEGVDACYRELQRVDPALAERIASTDRQRISRGLEVFAATEKPLSLWQEESRSAAKPSGARLRLLLEPERAYLYQRCEKRFDAMIEQGALEEVAALQDGRGDIATALRRIHGVAPLHEYLLGKISLDEAIIAAKQQTRNYAKRQTTWARHRLSSWHRLGEGDSETSLAAALSLLEGTHLDLGAQKG